MQQHIVDLMSEPILLSVDLTLELLGMNTVSEVMSLCVTLMLHLLLSSNFYPSPQPFTHSFKFSDIHCTLSPDPLHQVIKGTFKDHLVEWVNQYLHIAHGETRALAIIADIDRR